MTQMKKMLLTDAEKVTADLISKARKPKGVAQWSKLAPLKEKLEGKQQSHIQFTSYNPKAYGKKRTLASKEGMLDFLMGYVSPKFFFAPYHLQIINPDLDDAQAKDWFLRMGHPSRVAPQVDKLVEPEGDVDQGWCSDTVASLFPGKQFSLAFKVPQNVSTGATDEGSGASAGTAAAADGAAGGSSKKAAAPDTVAGGGAEEKEPPGHEVGEAPHPVEPAFAEGHDAHPEEEVGKPSDLLLACPFGGGSRCRAQAGSGSPFHHINSDSMRAHIERIAAEVGGTTLPKMGSFRGEPALFFEHKGSPYVAVPTRQEVHAKNGSVYKWSFLSEGPLAGSNPFLSRVMNQMAPRRPVLIPHFDIPEAVVTISHDAVPSEDPMECMFAAEVFQLVKDHFPRPGSVVPLGIIKGDKVFAVVTDRSLDFYTENGQDTFFPAADGMYYAYFDLTGKETPAIVLLSFINLFMSHIDTTPLEQQIQQQEDVKSEVLYGEPTPGFEDVPAEAPAVSAGAFVTEEDSNFTFAGTAAKYAQWRQAAVEQYDITAISKPDNWLPYDLPPLSLWKFTCMDQEWLLAQRNVDVGPGGKTKTGKVLPKYSLITSDGKIVANSHDILTCLHMAQITGLKTSATEALGLIGLLSLPMPAGCTHDGLAQGSDAIVADDSPLAAVALDEAKSVPLGG